jgi:hypothetical protein
MPGISNRVNDHFSIWISIGRSSQSSAKNENKGVLPDNTVSPEKALNVAYSEALNHILQSSKDEDWKNEVKETLAKIEQR